jgi:hypothetical protein
VQVAKGKWVDENVLRQQKDAHAKYVCARDERVRNKKNDGFSVKSLSKVDVHVMSSITSMRWRRTRMTVAFGARSKN